MSLINRGDRGAAVILLQGILHKLGHEISNIDGAFGKETEEAVNAFQEDHGLDVDGKVGEDTAHALVSEIWALEQAEESYS